MTRQRDGENAVTLLRSGVEFFPALRAAIDTAQRSIHIETYIFEPDETGHAIATALRFAVARGVNVRLVVDGFGSRDFVDAMLEGLRAAGLEIHVFRHELSRLALQRRRLRRLHRKTAVIDGTLGFIGGINLIDDSNTPHHDPPRFDYAVSLRGPIVADIAAAQASLWRVLSWARLQRRPAPPPPAPRPAAAGKVAAELVLRDNLRRRRDIENAYLTAINNARREILIANAYFLPGRRFRKALIDASRRGVTVTLLLQGRTEYWLMHQAEQALYPLLLAAGVRIVTYRKSFLHAKVAVVDDNWATVGSSNIDPFSLLLAREANVIVRDAGFCRHLRHDLEQAMQEGGLALSENHWQQLSWPRRVLSWGAFGLVRWLVGRFAARDL